MCTNYCLLDITYNSKSQKEYRSRVKTSIDVRSYSVLININVILVCSTIMFCIYGCVSIKLYDTQIYLYVYTYVRCLKTICT